MKYLLVPVALYEACIGEKAKLDVSNSSLDVSNKRLLHDRRLRAYLKQKADAESKPLPVTIRNEAAVESSDKRLFSVDEDGAVDSEIDTSKIAEAVAEPPTLKEDLTEFIRQHSEDLKINSDRRILNKQQTHFMLNSDYIKIINYALNPQRRGNKPCGMAVLLERLKQHPAGNVLYKRIYQRGGGGFVIEIWKS